MKLFSTFFCVLSNDLRLAYRHRSEISVPLFFFVIVVSLFPLAIQPEPEVLQGLAPAVIWIAALLGTLLGLNSLFYSDFLDGSLEQLLLSPYPLSWLVLAKIMAHWLVTGVPLILTAPLLAFSFYLPAKSILWLCISLLIGTPTLSLIGAMGLSLTLGLRNGGVLLSLLVLPLYIPILIFGVGVAGGAESVLWVQMAWLSAFLFLSLSLCPWVTASTLKMSIL